VSSLWAEDLAGAPVAATAEVERPEAGAFRTVLFTDVEGSTALTPPPAVRAS
jgi:hypothetical protein